MPDPPPGTLAYDSTPRHPLGKTRVERSAAQVLPVGDRRLAVLHAVFLLALLAAVLPRPSTAQPHPFQPGDRVVFIGGTFAERLQYASHFESLLATRLATYGLTFRNLGWSGDTVTLRPRPLNFGSLHRHLSEQQADVVVVCFGANESFDGEAGLASFSNELSAFVDTLLNTPYNGISPPRVVLVSPVAHEDLGLRGVDVEARNRDLALYAGAVEHVAARRGLAFVDLFSPSLALVSEPDGPRLTFNGVHLTEYGDWAMSLIMAQSLGLHGPWRLEIDVVGASFVHDHAPAPGQDEAPLPDAGDRGRLPGDHVEGWFEEGLARDLVATGSSIRFTVDPRAQVPPPPEPFSHARLRDGQPHLVVHNLPPGRYRLLVNDREVAEGDHEAWAHGLPVHTQAPDLREAVIRKNDMFFHRWRPVNGEYVYGRRAEPFGVVNFPGEMAFLDDLVRAAENAINARAAANANQVWELLPAGNAGSPPGDAAVSPRD